MKKAMLLLLTILLTGCSTKYNLNFENGNFQEKIEIELPSTMTQSEKEELKNRLPIEYPLVDDYESDYKKYTFLEENQKFTLQYNFDYQNYKLLSNSTILNNCFSNPTIEETDEYVYIRAAGNFNCMYDNINVDINIIINDGYVSKHNAKKVKKNTYSWNITPLTKEDLNLEMMIMKNAERIANKESKIGNIFKIILVISLICAGIYLVKNYKKEEA